MRWLCVVVLAWSLCGQEPFISDADWQRGSQAAGSQAAQQPSMGSAALALGLGLVVVLAIGGGLVLAARHLGRRRLAGRPAQRLRLLESLPLGVKQHLHLVQLGDQVLVVGSHERGLTAITTVPSADLEQHRLAALAAEAAEDPAPAVAPPPGPPFAQAFASAVQAVLGREKK